MAIKTAIIILNWNGRAHTLECLDSIPNGKYHLIVVDNGSTDGLCDYLREYRKEIHLIENPKNYGFAYANNQGAKLARELGAEYCFLLNNDTVIESDSVKKLEEEADKHPDVTLFVPKILNYYKRNMIESAGGDLNFLLGQACQRGYGERDKGQYDEEKYVDFAPGCALLLRLSDIKDDLFDDAFFAYWEDMDLSYRIKKQGKQIRYVPKAKIWHKVSASTGGYKNPLATYLSTRNRILFMRKHALLKEQLVFFPYFLFLYSPLFIISNILQGKISHVVRYVRASTGLIIKSQRLSGLRSPNVPMRLGVNARHIQRQRTGIENVIYNQTRGLASDDKLYLFCCKHLPMPAINGAQIVTSIFPTKNSLLRLIWEQIILPFELLWSRIDVYHGTSFVLPSWKSCKYILSVYDLSHTKHPEWYRLWHRIYLKVLLGSSIKKADKIITVSEATKKDINKLFKVENKRISVVYPGVDKQFISPLSISIESVRRKYKLPKEYYLFVGTVSPRKNLDCIVEAIHRSKNKFHIVVSGMLGWYYDDVLDKIEKYGLNNYVHILGYVPDEELHALYKSSKALVFPSYFEGFGIPIIEAMASGCPVITASNTSLPEAAGDAALFIDPNNPQSLLEAMNKLESERGMLIEKGKIHAKKFTWQKSARELQSVYQEII